MNKLTLNGNMEQTLLISAVRYAFGRSTYMPHLTCEVIARHIEELDPATAAIIARDIRNQWSDYEGPDSVERFRTKDAYYDLDVAPFTNLLGLLDRRSTALARQYPWIPYMPSRYERWEDVPAEIRWDGGTGGSEPPAATDALVDLLAAWEHVLSANVTDKNARGNLDECVRSLLVKAMGTQASERGDAHE